MIEGNGTALAENAFEDAIEATVFMATVHVREGELMLPQRIRQHLADGPVVVHLMRGEDDVAVHEATLTSRSTLTGITWPDDVKPRTSLTVLCPRGGASHDVGVLLPNLPEPERADDGLCEKCVAPYVDDPEGLGLCRQHLAEHYDAEAAAEREADDEPDDGEPEADPVESMTEREAGALAFILSGLAEFEQTVFTPDAQPGPAEYALPAAKDDTVGHQVAGELDIDSDPANEPEWPVADDLAAGETTEVLTAVLVPAEPDPTEGDVEPGTVFSAALVAVRTPPPPKPQRGWLERRVRLLARLVLEESRTATRVALAAASGLVLAGAGLGYLVQLVVTW
jgi:hypothetical protein